MCAKLKASERKRRNSLEFLSSEIRQLKLALNIMGRSKVPFSACWDVMAYNNNVVPFLERMRFELDTKEEKEAFDNKMESLVEMIDNIASSKPIEKGESFDSEERKLKNEAENKMKESKKFSKFIKDIGGVDILIKYLKITARVHIDKAIVKRANRIQKKKISFFKKLRYEYPSKVIAVRLMKEYDTSILSLRLGEFDNYFSSWKEAIRKSEKERYKHYTDKNSTLLE